MQLFKKFTAWLSKLDEFDKQAKKIRCEDRRGEYDYTTESVKIKK